GPIGHGGTAGAGRGDLLRGVSVRAAAGRRPAIPVRADAGRPRPQEHRAGPGDGQGDRLRAAVAGAGGAAARPAGRLRHRLHERCARAVALTASEVRTSAERLRNRVLRPSRPNKRPPTVYDSFMLKSHDFLKANVGFQEHGPKKYWSFSPGSAWLAMTDTCS